MMKGRSYAVFEEGGKTNLILEDCNSFEVEEWLTGTLAGTEFPVICCVGSCRASLNAHGHGDRHERSLMNSFFSNSLRQASYNSFEERAIIMFPVKLFQCDREIIWTKTLFQIDLCFFHLPV